MTPGLTLLRRRFTDAEAAEVASWIYPPPYDVYDTAEPGLFLARAPDGEGYYPAIDDSGRVVAFAVIGAEARVGGQEPAPGIVDLGMGVRPDATGQGRGTDLLRQALSLARDLAGPTAVRAAVATFNQRSLALCARAGFRAVRDFAGPGDRAFRELILDLPAEANEVRGT